MNDEEIQYEEISDFYSKVSGLEWQSMTEGQNGENAEITITFEKKAVYRIKLLTILMMKISI